MPPLLAILAASFLLVSTAAQAQLSQTQLSQKLELNFGFSHGRPNCELVSEDPEATRLTTGNSLLIYEGSCRYLAPLKAFDYCALDRFHLDVDFVELSGAGSRGCTVQLLQDDGSDHAWAFDVMLERRSRSQNISCHFACLPGKDATIRLQGHD